MDNKKRYKRVKKVFECANPLFEKWLTEWYDEAAARGWKSQHNYKKALQSLKRYPLPLKSGKESQILENFGVKIGQMLDKKLEEYTQNGGELPETVNTTPENNTNEETDEESRPIQKRKAATRSREYVPVIRSGAYALLITLYKNHDLNGPRAFMKKNELMDAAQPLSEKSFRVPEPGSFYTAWSSMGILIRKGLVLKESSPAKYFLNERGMELAEKILEAEKEKEQSQNLNPSQNDDEIHVESNLHLPQTSNNKFTYCYVTEKGEEVREKDRAIVNIEIGMIGFLIKCDKDALLSSGRCFKIDTKRPSIGNFIYAFLHDSYADSVIDSEYFLKNETSNISPSSSCGQFILHPGQFEIVLCVDNCETVSGEVNSRKLMIQNDLRKNGITYDVRKLHIGDYVWIAREKVSLIPGQLRLPKSRELVLDYIVERKRMDDLSSSIKDGRFHEQKFRLKECGLRHPIYLVEEIGTTTSLPESTLMQAISNTQIIDGFTIKETKNNSDSVRFLTIMTRYLQSLYSNKVLTSCSKDELIKSKDQDGLKCLLMTFEEFNSSSVKNKDMTVRDLFVKQLMQLHGLSIDKALAIIDRYPTPNSLICAYKQCSSEKEMETLVANLKFGLTKRNLGPSISKVLHQLYTRKTLI